MAKFDARKTMEDALNKNEAHLPCWQCENCGNSYSTLEELQKTPCPAYKGVKKCDCGEGAKEAYELFGQLWDAYRFKREQVHHDCKDSPDEQKVTEYREAKSIVEKYLPSDISSVNVNQLASDIGAGRLFSNPPIGYKRAAKDLINALSFSAFVAKESSQYNRKEDLHYFKEKVEEDNFWLFLFVISHFGAYWNDEKEEFIPLDKCTFSMLNNCIVVPILNERNEETHSAMTMLKFYLNATQSRIRKGELRCHESWINNIGTVMNNFCEDYDYWNAVYAMIGLKLPWDNYFDCTNLEWKSY